MIRLSRDSFDKILKDKINELGNVWMQIAARYYGNVIPVSALYGPVMKQPYNPSDGRLNNACIMQFISTTITKTYRIKNQNSLGIKELIPKAKIDCLKLNPLQIEYEPKEKDEYNENTFWCSAFANHVMHESGIPGTGSLAAIKWKSWGEGLDYPFYGAIAVCPRFSKDNPDAAHVGFFCKELNGEYLILGGNQGKQVNASTFSKDKFVFRWPKGITKPELIEPFYEMDKL